MQSPSTIPSELQVSEGGAGNPRHPNQLQQQPREWVGRQELGSAQAQAQEQAQGREQEQEAPRPWGPPSWPAQLFCVWGVLRQAEVERMPSLEYYGGAVRQTSLILSQELTRGLLPRSGEQASRHPRAAECQHWTAACDARSPPSASSPPPGAAPRRRSPCSTRSPCTCASAR
jgi:hypothetical protein